MLQLFNKLHEEWPKAYLYSVRLALFHCFSSFEKEKEIKQKLSTFHLFSIKLDKHTCIMRVLGPGFWGTRRLAKLAVGYTRSPAPERLIIHVCNKQKIVPHIW